MDKKIEEIEFTIFDTETTGLDPSSGDRVVELAGIRVRGKERLATFQTLVNPRRPISEAAFQVNRITPQMISLAPDIEKVIPDFLSFIKGSCLCSYNAGFDWGFLTKEMELSGQELPEDIRVVDILKMSRRLLPGLERYALWFVAEKLGVKNKQQHRALSDVEMTLDVFNLLKDMLRLKGITEADNFFHLFGLNKNILEIIETQKISQIQEALGLGVKLKIKYLSSSGANVTEREVIPKEVRKERNQVYLIGHCCLRDEERSFRIDGILHLEILP